MITQKPQQPRAPRRGNAVMRVFSFANAAVCSLVYTGVLAFARCGAAETPLPQPTRVVRIDSVRVERIPVVRHDSLFFTLQCFCNGLPGNYWYYFDSSQSHVVIEVFESGVDDYDVKFLSYSPFRWLHARTVETGMALTRAETRVIIDFDKGKSGGIMWNGSVSMLGGKGFSVTIAKPITDNGYVRHKRTTRVVAIVTSLSIALLAVAAGVALLFSLQ
ncbi:MAG TPA: hypothetical protein VKF42_03100 [Chitinivibrionales bacterium]|nr:hypothetical protein [Chitinivibrionales bacterium]